MSNQFSNQFQILNANSRIALNDGIGLVPPQLVQGQVNSAANHATASIWPNVGTSATANEINYNLLVNNHQQQHQQQQVSSYSAETNLAEISPRQDMSQTAQIVLLPTQNINLVANVPKQEPVQMILPNDVGYQLISSIPNVNVLVPTNILLTNGYILIPNSCQSIPIANSPASTQSNETTITSNQNSPIYLNQNWVESDQGSQHHHHHYQQQQQQQQQLIAANVEIIQDGQSQQLAQNQECEFIALADTGTQTVLSGIADNELAPTAAAAATAHLISNNGQIVGIIGGDQLGILQADPGGENQVLLAIDPNESGIALTAGGGQVQSGGANYDINAILASTISSTLAVQKTDQNQAKQWLKDSYIVNRALKALKKTNSSSHHHHHQHSSSRPHSQIRR